MAQSSLSLPVWEEWIEMDYIVLVVYPDGTSLPVWEEWIEIPSRYCFLQIGRSLPVWEEWIEIKIKRHTGGISPSLPVWEEWIEIFLRGGIAPAPNVSSRMGRVD